MMLLLLGTLVSRLLAARSAVVQHDRFGGLIDSDDPFRAEPGTWIDGHAQVVRRSRELVPLRDVPAGLVGTGQGGAHRPGPIQHPAEAVCDVASQRLAEGVVPQLADGDGFGYFAHALPLEVVRQLQQPDNVVAVDVAQDDEIQLATVVSDAVEQTLQVALVDVIGPAIHEQKPGGRRHAVLEDQAIPIPCLDNVKVKHDAKPPSSSTSCEYEKESTDSSR
jgi:hypothetical protein